MFLVISFYIIGFLVGQGLDGGNFQLGLRGGILRGRVEREGMCFDRESK